MKILFIAPLIPYPLEEGGNPRTFEFLKTLCRDHDVYFISFIENEDETAHLSFLNEICGKVEVVHKRIHLRRYKLLFPLVALISFLSGLPYCIAKFRSKVMKSKIRELLNTHRFDIVHIDHLCMSQFADPNRGPITILHEHNVESLYVKRYAANQGVIKKIYATVDYLKLKRYEAKICNRVDRVLVVSEDDKYNLSLLSGNKARISVIHSGIDTEYWRQDDGDYDTEKISFLGRMDYVPNVDGIKWFCGKVLPLIRDKIPGVKLFLVGSHPSREIKSLANGKNIIITGYVDDVRPYLIKSALSVIPFLYGGGLKIKALIAMSMDIPIISTSIGCEGIEAEDGKHVFIADEPDLFAKRAIEVMSDARLRSELSRNGRRLVIEKYTCENMRKEITQIYREQYGH